MKNIKKLLVCFFCMLLVLASLSSCSLYLEPQNDIELYNVIDCFYEDKIPSYLSYKDERYICDRNGIFQPYIGLHKPHKDDMLLSWNGNKYINIHTNKYYADTTDSPIFIYESRCGYVFFREDYDFLSDTFVIEGTTIEFLFSDMFEDFSKSTDMIDSGYFDNGYQYPEYNLYSKENPRIKTTLRLDCSQESCYIAFSSIISPNMWECSDSFVELLKSNGLV